MIAESFFYTGDSMKIKFINVSGKDDGLKEVEIDKISVGNLLEKLGIDVFGVMVCRNGDIVREHDIVVNNDTVTISGMGCC